MSRVTSQGRTSRRLGGLGAILVVAAGVAWLIGPQTTVGTPAEFESRVVSVTDGEPTVSTTSTLPVIASGTPLASSIQPNEVSLLADVASDPTRIPVGLTIGAIEVEAGITRVGVDERTGQMEVPANVADVAWYQHGPSPGESGSAVLAAHVDLAGQGAGVFFNLRRLEPGDTITVAYDDGTTELFRVEARTVYEKSELPLDVIFSRTGAPVLTLVTCGGGFNTTLQSYDSNVVVYAVPFDPLGPGKSAS